MNRNTTASVRSVFDRLEKRLDTYTFLSMFEYILTDYAEVFYVLPEDPNTVDRRIHELLYNQTGAKKSGCPDADGIP